MNRTCHLQCRNCLTTPDTAIQPSGPWAPGSFEVVGKSSPISELPRPLFAPTISGQSPMSAARSCRVPARLISRTISTSRRGYATVADTSQSRPEEFDVVIVGGGPAGLALAAALGTSGQFPASGLLRTKLNLFPSILKTC